MTRLTERIRKNAFWIVDFIKGGEIKRHYNDIKFILENYHSKEAIDKRASHVLSLLEHAVSSAPFYSEFKNFKSLDDFPVIDKNVIREKFVELQSAKFTGKSNHTVQTSGSSGTTTTTLQNIGKLRRNTADTIYFKQQAGFELGFKLYYIRKWFKMHTKSPLITRLRNIVMVDVTMFSDEYISEFIQQLKSDKSTKVLLGYSSAYRDICRYLDKINSKPIKTNISCIIAMSESLSDHTKESLEKYFEVPVISRYSNLENGIFSMQLPNQGSNFHINWASYHIELLHPENNNPVKYGELGRVVITDLFNYCMPIIRYDTGDLAVMTNNNLFFNNAPAFTKVEGRKMDILYDTAGNAKSPFIVFHLESYPEIKQFQIIQNGEKEYTLKLNLEGVFQHEKEVIELYSGYFGQDAAIKIEYVNEIPHLSSGKRRLTANEFLLGK